MFKGWKKCWNCYNCYSFICPSLFTYFLFTTTRSRSFPNQSFFNLPFRFFPQANIRFRNSKIWPSLGGILNFLCIFNSCHFLRQCISVFFAPRVLEIVTLVCWGNFVNLSSIQWMHFYHICSRSSKYIVCLDSWQWWWSLKVFVDSDSRVFLSCGMSGCCDAYCYFIWLFIDLRKDKHLQKKIYFICISLLFCRGWSSVGTEGPSPPPALAKCQKFRTWTKWPPFAPKCPMNAYCYFIWFFIDLRKDKCGSHQ